MKREVFQHILGAIAAVCAIVIGVESTTADERLREALHHYEVISLSDIRHHRVRRSASSETRHMEFDALNRHFRLKLWTHKDILASDVRIVSLDAESNERDVPLDNRKFYHGRLEDDETSRVTAYEDDDGTLTATIRTQEDVYSIEPLWRHLPNENKSSLIAYRNSDMNMTSDIGAKYCGFVRPEEEYPDLAEQMKKYQEKESQTHRVKREDEDDDLDNRPPTPRKSTCPLLLVADYRFFREVGQSSHSRTASYLIGLADRVDTIYRGTNFGGAYHGMGFEIKEIKIHNAPTKTKDHYNVEQSDAWETRTLLEAFSADDAYREFCLAHLFTYQDFDGGVLGLAYIGSSRTYSVGGICSPVYRKQGRQLYLNTGWSSGLGKHDRRLLTQEADLVTTHGHNWGSEHDPDNPSCSPKSSAGGKYIMYTYSVSGYDRNNRVFSPCSRTSIQQVLASKSGNCFKEPRGMLCGNSRVEKQQCDGDDCDNAKDEECDAGPHTPEGKDACCDQYCQLRPESQCSDVNDNCCQNCTFAASTVICHEAQNDTCELDTYCTGNDKACPQYESKADDTPCAGRGTCKNGTCQAFCETVDLQSCVCDEEALSCRFCCRENDTAPCEAYQDSTDTLYYLPDGQPCATGACVEGKCTKQVQDLIERFWDIIEDLTPSRLVAFMKANIVGTVICLSLLIWIPASCVVSHVDRKRRLEDEQDMEWKAATNRTMVHPVDAPRMKLQPVPGHGTTYRRPHVQTYPQVSPYHPGEKVSGTAV